MSSLLIDAWRRDPKIWSCSSIISPFGKSSSLWRYKALIKASKLLLPVPIFPIVLDVLSTQLIPHKVKSPFCALSPIFYEYLIAQAWLVVSFQLWTKYVGSHCHLSPSKALTSCRARPSARWGKRWTAVGEQLQIGPTRVHTHIFNLLFCLQFCWCLCNLQLCLALCKFKTQVYKLNLRSRIKDITFYQRLWKYWSSTSSVKVQPGSYSESHWSCSAAFLTACSPTASSSCLFCCHSSSPLPIPYPCHRLGDSPGGNKS